MHRLGTACARRLDQCSDIEIARARICRTDPNGRIGEARMQRAGIRVGIHRDDMHAEPLRRAGDAAGDLAAIGDQKRLEHVPLARAQSAS